MGKKKFADTIGRQRRDPGISSKTKARNAKIAAEKERKRKEQEKERKNKRKQAQRRLKEKKKEKEKKKQEKKDKEKKHMCLNMIVKNEAHVIKNVLECMKKYIDYYVIVDTGSTDNTKTIIKDYFNNNNIKGEIHDVPWKNFGYNRTKALELCRGKAEYCWVIDADDIICGDLVLPDKLTKD